MNLSCAFAPGKDTPAHIELAEQLGYKRAWVYDSPCFYHDAWATLARAADRTASIGLATGVSVVGLRHVAVTAAAIAGLAALAPGRVVYGVGAGGTATRMLGQRAARWDDVRSYAEAVRALLRGESIRWQDADVRLMHPPAIGGEATVDVPVVFAVAGPRGDEVARESGDGVLTLRPGAGVGFDWHCRLAFGTVLDEGEDESSPRILDAAGPGVGIMYHQTYASGNFEALHSLPRGQEYAAEMDALPESSRTPELWEGHLVSMTERDRRFISPETVAKLTLTGSPTEVRGRVDELEQTGVSELMFQPCGADIPRELRAFAAALG